MERKNYRKYLNEENSRIEADMNQLEKTLGLNKNSKTILGEVSTLPLKVAGEIYAKLAYLGANIVKHPVVLINYVLQKNW